MSERLLFIEQEKLRFLQAHSYTPVMSSEHLSRPMVTLAEVAREAGVSPSTVSRIVNGTAKVKDSKAQQVRRAIEKLGYKPNAFARSLVTGASGTVGVLTQDR